MTSLRIDAQRTISGISDYLKQVIERDGTKGVMLTFDDFVEGMKVFGEKVQPLMKSRSVTVS